MNKQLTQGRNFDEVEFISGYVMRLIKLTEQNIKLAKQEREKMLNYKNIITINYEQAKQTKPDYQRKERTYGFENEDQEKYFLRGIEAVSFVYNFNYKLTKHD